MEPIKVSVIIPTYNQADFLAAAVRSVLDQTYSNVEIVVINDASTDHTDDIMARFDDPRIKYLKHRENRYAAAARNTGIRASSGELLAFVDADDLVHPDKIRLQVDFLKCNPEIGLTYNSRFEIDSTGQLISIVQAPAVVTLKDLVLGYPFAPSEVVMRRELAIRVGLFDERFVFHGEDPDFFLRLALDDCQMAGVSKALNYRRLHVGRTFRNLENVAADEIRAFKNAFANPRCPTEVLALRDRSLANVNMIMGYHALVQSQTDLGHRLIREAIRYDCTLFSGRGCEFLRFLVVNSVRDGGDHEKLLRRIFAQLPSELDWMKQHVEPAVADGYLLRGTRHVMWSRMDRATEDIGKAAEIGVRPSESFLKAQVAQLLAYEADLGQESAENVLQNLSIQLKKVASGRYIRRMNGLYAFNKALEDYRQHNAREVIPGVIKAIINDPAYLINRGALAIFFRSISDVINGSNSKRMWLRVD